MKNTLIYFVLLIYKSLLYFGLFVALKIVIGVLYSALITIVILFIIEYKSYAKRKSIQHLSQIETPSVETTQNKINKSNIKEIGQMDFKQMQKFITDLPGTKTLNKSQYIPNSHSIFDESQNLHWIGGAVDTLELDDNQLILVESVDSISSRDCKVNLHNSTLYYQLANVVVR